jgi:death-on-curing protein
VTWVWIDPAVVELIHEEQLAEHGGAGGLRDAGLLASALARAQNLAAYGEPDAADLAAAYGFGLAKNHPFIDGNKRTAAVLTRLFLLLNGQDLVVTEPDVVVTFLALASGELTEAELATWVRSHLAAAR